MRKVIFGINLSLDGCCDHTKFGGGEDVLKYFTQLMEDVDLIVYGRKMYELMFPYWSDVAKNQSGTKDEIEFAQTLMAIDKVVFSQSLDRVEGNARIVRSNPAEELLKLKQETGKKIAVDSVSLYPEFLELGLIDEFYFVVHPVFVGEGRRLLDGVNLQESISLNLVDSKAIGSGCVALRYNK